MQMRILYQYYLIRLLEVEERESIVIFQKGSRKKSVDESLPQRDLDGLFALNSILDWEC